MSNESNTLEDRLSLLEKYQVFLGVIVALVMQIVWDFLDRDILNGIWRFVSIIFFGLCVSSLMSVCIFYYLLYKGKKETAEQVVANNLIVVSFIFLAAFLTVSMLFMEKELYVEAGIVWLLSLIVIIYQVYIKGS